MSPAGGRLRAASLPRGLEPPQASRHWKYIVVHHTATASGDVETIDRAHRRRTDTRGNPWLGIGYHFVIGNGQGMPDGLIEPTFRWSRQLHGAHAGSRLYNEQGIGICLIGDFEQQPPTPRQLAALKELVGLLAQRYTIEEGNIVRHLDVAATECPGRLLLWDEISTTPSDLYVRVRNHHLIK